MDSTDAPVSTAVELATLVIKAFRYLAGTLRCGLVSMSGLFFIVVAPVVEFNSTSRLRRWLSQSGLFRCAGGHAHH